MEQRDYQNKLKEVNQIYSELAPKRKALIASFNNASQALQGFLENEKSGWDNFVKYSKNLETVSYAGEVTKASDVFPGIRTIDLQTEIEDMADLQEEMKTQAEAYDNALDAAGRLQNTALSSLKVLYQTLGDYFEGASAVTDAELDLLKELDSVYDVRLLKQLK